MPRGCAKIDFYGAPIHNVAGGWGLGKTPPADDTAIRQQRTNDRGQATYCGFGLCAKKRQAFWALDETIRRRPSDRQGSWSCVGTDPSCVRPSAGKLRTIGLRTHFGPACPSNGSVP